MSVWTTPRVWATNEVPTSAHMNTYNSGNDQYLKDQSDIKTLVTVATKGGIAAGTGSTVITWNANSIDTLGAYNASNAYLLCTTAGFYEMDFLTTWTGATGSGGAWLQIDRYNSSGVFVETWGFDDNGNNINLAVSAHGAGVISANDRIVCTSNTSATGTGGTVVARGVLLRRY